MYGVTPLVGVLLGARAIPVKAGEGDKRRKPQVSEDKVKNNWPNIFKKNRKPKHK